MFDTVAQTPTARPTALLERVRGRAVVRLDGGSRLVDLAQAGAAKAMLPAPAASGAAAPEVVFLNTAGGLTGGDRLDYALTLDAGARATATTQTAERAYASPGGPARVTCRFEVGAGAALDWLPQETILFEASDLERVTQVALAGDARCLLCETLVLGRAAMGETLRAARLDDRREVTRDGRPVLIDRVAIDAEVLAEGQGPAGLGGARAFAMLALVAAGAEDAAGPLRALLAGADGLTSGVSGWDGRCVARLVAADGWPVRRALAAALRHLRGRALPRVWQI
jgi:urease accessory protein